MLVRGETIRNQEPQPPPNDKEKSPRKEVAEAKIKMQSRLPALYDDADVGVQMEQIVIRDGKASWVHDVLTWARKARLLRR